MLKSKIATPDINSYRPHLKQTEFHSSPSKTRLYVGGNRCLALGTLVLKADGTEVPIEELSVGDFVVSGTGQKTRVIATHSNGVKPVFKYKIGRYKDVVEVVCTPDHKFLSATEKHGSLSKFSKNPISSLVDKRGRHKIKRSQGTNLGGKIEDRAFILGLMLGDGYLPNKTKSQLQFTCADKRLAEEVSDVFKNVGGIQYKFINPDMWFKWFKDLGLIGTKSNTKFIPKEVWSWDEESVAELCAGLIITDGSFYYNKNLEFHMTYSSNSYELISEFRRLMGIRLGIWGSTITYEKRGTYQVSYGTYEALTKIKELPILGVKEDRLDSIHTRNSFSSYMGVKEYEYVGELPTYDITVEDESHTFILANGLITSNSGKTYGNIAECVYWLTKQHPYRAIPVGEYEPTRGRINTVDFVNGAEKIILPLLKQLVPPSYLIDGSWDKSYNKHLRILTLNNKSFVEILSYESDLDKFAGTSRHFISYDEEPPEVIYTENLARLVDTGGHQWLSLTPVEGMSWIYDEIYTKGRSGNPNYHNTEISMEENPYLNQEEVRNFLEGLSEDERKARGEGKFVEFGGLIYKNFDSREDGKHVIDLGAKFKPSKDIPVGISLDHGFNNPTAVLWHMILPEGRIITFHEHYLSGETVSYHAREIYKYNKLMGIEPHIMIADPSIRNTDPLTGTSILQEYIKYGLPFTLANNDVRAGIERVNKYLKPRAGGEPLLKIDKSCTNLIKEMARYKWKTYTSKKLNARYNAWEEPHKLHDHACDSLRYFLMSRPDLDTLYLEENTKLDMKEFYDGTVRGMSSDFTVRSIHQEEYREVMAKNSDYTDMSDDLMGGLW